jgi:hypothetical protein
MSTPRAYFHIPSDPLKGTWVDLTAHTTIDDIAHALASAGHVPPGYAGPMQVSRAEGLAFYYVDSRGNFDLQGLSDAASRLTQPEQQAYIAYRRSAPPAPSVEDFLKAYEGEWPSFEAYLGYLEQLYYWEPSDSGGVYIFKAVVR